MDSKWKSLMVGWDRFTVYWLLVFAVLVFLFREKSIYEFLYRRIQLFCFCFFIIAHFLTHNISFHSNNSVNIQCPRKIQEQNEDFFFPCLQTLDLKWNMQILRNEDQTKRKVGHWSSFKNFTREDFVLQKENTTVKPRYHEVVGTYKKRPNNHASV